MRIEFCRESMTAARHYENAASNYTRWWRKHYAQLHSLTSECCTIWDSHFVFAAVVGRSEREGSL